MHELLKVLIRHWESKAQLQRRLEANGCQESNCDPRAHAFAAATYEEVVSDARNFLKKLDTLRSWGEGKEECYFPGCVRKEGHKGIHADYESNKEG